jgi:glycosyltransferase involved in cell wall biosynthesis
LSEASLYVQTSRWEGMPLSVLQALAAGVPCVVTDVVGNRDAVRQGITGFVVDGVDAMLVSARRLLQDDELRHRMSHAARLDALERFGSRSFRSRLCQLYGLADSAQELLTSGAGNRLRLQVSGPVAANARAEPDWRRQANG